MSTLEFDFIVKREELILHPSFKAALQTLQDAYSQRRNFGLPQNFLLLGPSGAGKSTLIKTIKKQYPPYEGQNRLLKPIVSVVVPSKPTVKGLAQEILFVLGDPFFEKGSSTSKTARIIHLLKELEVQLIAFDEMHHFLDHGTKANTEEVADWLKNLIEAAQVSTVLCGLERTENLLIINEQLRRRFSQNIVLEPFSIRNKKSFTIFTGLVYQFFGYLRLSKPMEVEEDLVNRMHFATNGIFDYLRKIMTGVHDILKTHQHRIVTYDVLRKAFYNKIWKTLKVTHNPFSDKFAWRRLDKRGEPFYRPHGEDKKKKEDSDENQEDDSDQSE